MQTKKKCSACKSKNPNTEFTRQQAAGPIALFMLMHDEQLCRALEQWTRVRLPQPVTVLVSCAFKPTAVQLIVLRWSSSILKPLQPPTTDFYFVEIWTFLKHLNYKVERFKPAETECVLLKFGHFRSVMINNSDILNLLQIILFSILLKIGRRWSLSETCNHQSGTDSPKLAITNLDNNSASEELCQYTNNWCDMLRWI